MMLDRPAPSPPRIALSPLIDVLFILLVFVILSARFVQEERLDVDVPRAAAGRPAELVAVVVVIDQDGAVRLDGERIQVEALPDLLGSQRHLADRVVVVADGGIPLQQAIDVISAARLAGFQVAVGTRPPEP